MKPQSVLIYIFLFTAMIAINNNCEHDKEFKRLTPPKTEIALQSIEKSYKQSFANYKKANMLLNKKLLVTDSLLKEEKKRLLPVQKKVKVIVNSDWNIPEKEKLEKCDSLVELVKCYEDEREVTDSLTAEKISSLNAKIMLKDYIISKCDSIHEQLKAELETCSSENTACFEELQKEKRHEKRHRFFNKVFSTCTIISTSIAGAFIISNAH